jgi:hypothetical protein
MSALRVDKDETLSGKQLSGLNVWLTEDNNETLPKGLPNSSELTALYELDQNLEALFKTNVCGPVTTQPAAPARGNAATPNVVGPFAVPIVVAASKLVFDLYVEKKKKDLDALKKSASQSSNADVVVSAPVFSRSSCIVLARYAKEDKEDTPGLIVVLKIEKSKAARDRDGGKSQARDETFADSFQIKPIFVRANNSIAVTEVGKATDKQQIAVTPEALIKQTPKKAGLPDNGIASKEVGEGPAKSKITVTPAVSIKQITKKAGIPTLALLGQGGSTISAVELSGTIRCRAKIEECNSSTAIPMPLDNGSVVVGVSLLETGNVGFDVDRATAELTAMQAAIGPAIGDAVQGHYDRKFDE